MNACPQCQQPIELTADDGQLICDGCGTSLWFAKLIDSYQVVTRERLETAFGFKANDFDQQEVVELVREIGERDDEPSHAWSVEDFHAANESPEQTHSSGTNPYRPPASLPRRTDPHSDSFLFVAAVPCDQETIRWSAKRFVRDSDMFGVMIMVAIVVVAFPLIYFEGLVTLLTAGLVPRWVVILLLLGLAYLFVSRVALRPIVRKLCRRCKEDPLFTQDYYWIYLRRWTLTAISHEHVVTWPLKSVRNVNIARHLIVLRPQRRRRLYIPSSSQTSPESFDAFRSGVKKRMRLFWREHFFRFDGFN